MENSSLIIPKNILTCCNFMLILKENIFIFKANNIYFMSFFFVIFIFGFRSVHTSNNFTRLIIDTKDELFLELGVEQKNTVHPTYSEIWRICDIYIIVTNLLEQISEIFEKILMESNYNRNMFIYPNLFDNIRQIIINLKENKYHVTYGTREIIRLIDLIVEECCWINTESIEKRKKLIVFLQTKFIILLNDIEYQFKETTNDALRLNKKFSCVRNENNEHIQRVNRFIQIFLTQIPRVPLEVGEAENVNQKTQIFFLTKLFYLKYSTFENKKEEFELFFDSLRKINPKITYTFKLFLISDAKSAYCVSQTRKIFSKEIDKIVSGLERRFKKDFEIID